MQSLHVLLLHASPVVAGAVCVAVSVAVRVWSSLCRAVYVCVSVTWVRPSDHLPAGSMHREVAVRFWEPPPDSSATQLAVQLGYAAAV